jgi:hypothetical protein
VAGSLLTEIATVFALIRGDMMPNLLAIENHVLDEYGWQITF